MLPLVRTVLSLSLGFAVGAAVCFVVVWQAGVFAGVADRFRTLLHGEDVPAVLAVSSLVIAVWSGVASHEEKVAEPWDDAKYF